ncbi:response regulator [Geomonas sp. RF6]|uniref:response regulator n=1 Tax=Geomonas sp. RF6 TaxID=2897342 RepID=UPI001E4CD4E9|nr:response regulator [Geomonas sp. RF6]UFS69508.1 response regulator [Geomonas sp. RF6]
MLALLIVEDDVETLNLYSKMIKASFPEIRVDTATNPEEAISQFDKNKHDIVVTDLRVPKKDDGLVIARTICEKKPNAVVLFVTAENSPALQALKPNLRHFCINEIFGKPLNVKKLIDKIAEVVAILGM